MIVICDSTALINLAKINQLRLLEDMYGGVLISQGIYDEVVVKGVGKVGSAEVQNAPFIQVKEVENPSDIELYIDPLSWEDAEVIVLAREQNADLIITRDRRLKSRANREGVPAITLRAFFKEAKEVGLIEAVKPLWDELRNKGVLIREGVYQEALREAGDSEDEDE